MMGFLGRLVLASGAAAAVMLLARQAVIELGVDSDSPADALVRLVVAGVLGAATFLVGSRVTRMDELNRLGAIVRRRP
jgi:hypothetical protein